ncbi:hypothetical protein EVAR_52356_1 [Eumeta japonica]|uniref:HAT C-terminal dimerisation domain-containing protein n=1 Tax=Eumeta variegata TaxID=151549 RepID=A0A4C1YTS4_EUMVA|nr:hypothetical protein EVAR_52356_1 [Eumeta japonica]
MDANFSPKDKFRVETFNVIVDRLNAQMERRSEMYYEISQKFSFLTDLQKSSTEYEKHVELLSKAYPEDFDNNFLGELIHFHKYFQLKPEDSSQKKIAHSELYETIIQHEIKCVLPNIEVALRTFLTLMITNCTAERSFSQLKRLQNPQRTKIGQEKLKSLALLYIEGDILREINFDDVISDFALKRQEKNVLRPQSLNPPLDSFFGTDIQKFLKISVDCRSFCARTTANSSRTSRTPDKGIADMIDDKTARASAARCVLAKQMRKHRLPRA